MALNSGARVPVAANAGTATRDHGRVSGVHEMWRRLNGGAWRCLREGAQAALLLACQKECEEFQDKGRLGEWLVAKVGDYPDHKTRGQFRATWPPTPMDSTGSKFD